MFISMVILASASQSNVPELYKEHEGVWEGSYRYLNADGSQKDFHKSVLFQKIEGNVWHQVNLYKWEDGKTRAFYFPGTFDKDGVMIMDNPRLYATIRVDERNVLMNWQYKEVAGSNNWEIISLPSDGTRARTWQLTVGGEVSGFTLISEKRTSSIQEACKDGTLAREIPEHESIFCK